MSTTEPNDFKKDLELFFIAVMASVIGGIIVYFIFGKRGV